MKKFLSKNRFVSLLILVPLFAAINGDTQIANDLPRRTIRVAIDNNYAPYSFYSSEGKLQGILVDQWKVWEKQTGIGVELFAFDWNQAVQRMREGQFDVIDCIVKTAEREEYFDFTPAYNKVQASIFFRANISGVTNLSSLKGFPVGVKKGDQHIDQLKDKGITTLMAFPTDEAIIEAALQHKINVFIADDLSALYLLHKHGIEGQFRQSASVFQDELRRGVRKGDTALLTVLSDGFNAIDRDELKRIDEKWFGRAIGGDDPYLRYFTYAGYVVAAAVLLILGLVAWNRTLKKKVLERTKSLQKTEDHLLQVVNAIPTMTWSLLPSGLVDFVNQPWLDYTGEKSLENATRIIHPDDVNGAVEKWMQNKNFARTYEDEMRLRSADGKYRWFLVRTSPLLDEQGNITKWYGVATDIEDKKLAEETLHKSNEEIRRLNEHLQKIREEERKSIAREIHDELGQQLTAIKMDVAWINKKIPEDSVDIRQKLNNVINLLNGSNHSIRRILSELRPRVLDNHGLLEAIEWLNRQMTEVSGIPVTFAVPEKEIRIPEHMATSIFRLCQEAFTNIIRYSQAKQVSVSISCRDSITLTIEDDGVGFNKESLAGKTSFGILGMKERVVALGGDFNLDSSLGAGTKITVRLPLET